MRDDSLLSFLCTTTNKSGNSKPHLANCFNLAAITLTLHAHIVTKQSAQDEILLWRKLVQRTSDEATHRVDALVSSEEEINVVLACRQYIVTYTLMGKALNGKVEILSVYRVENHSAYALLVLVNVVEQDLQVGWVEIF